MMFGRRRFVLFFISFTVAIIFLYSSFVYWYQIQNALTYSTRPLWDRADGPRRIIPHYDSTDLAITEDICALHGWKLRPTEIGEKKEMWDAVLFNSELDLLEIRWAELDPVVDKFFILESNRTFTGIQKPLTFALNRSSPRFARFAHKIVYKALEGPSLESYTPADAWAWESDQRSSMTSLIQSYIPTPPSSFSPSPLVLFADVDEIPSARTLALLKKCDFPSPIHLQMRNFIYSFEWPYGWGSWRAQVHEWQKDNTIYRHSMSSDLILADAGWHCSFCFRQLKEFAEKMQGYSHSDRIGGDLSLLEPKWIQKVICDGKDIFKMLPEAYSYREMLLLLNPEKSTSAVGLPRHLVENAQRFRYLLPGGCQREE